MGAARQLGTKNARQPSGVRARYHHRANVVELYGWHDSVTMIEPHRFRLVEFLGGLGIQPHQLRAAADEIARVRSRKP